jgi:phosphomevalonate kinase
VYRRFSPSVLSSLGEAGSPGFGERVRGLIDDSDGKWDVVIEKHGVTIPQGMALVMCDVDCGSNTPSMVKKVLAWKASDPAGSKKLWDELQVCNEHLGHLLTLSPRPPLSEFETAFSEIRSRIRIMGEKSGVPIEPPEQTALLDAVTKAVAGVAGGVVPGAGGYDAIVLLVQDTAETLDAIKEFLSKWSRENVSNVRLLGTKGELDGARGEDGEGYGEWV